METTNNKNQTTENIELAKLKDKSKKRTLYVILGFVGLLIITFLTITYLDYTSIDRDIRRDERKIGAYVKTITESLSEGNYFEAYAVVDEMKSGPYRIREKAKDLEEKILMEEIAAAIDFNNGDSEAARIIMAISKRFEIKSYKAKEMLEKAIELAELSGNGKLAARLREVSKEWDKK